MKVFCLDTETTAGMRNGRVVQYAIVDHGYEGEWLVNPPTTIQPGTIKVHRIRPDMLANEPRFSETAGYSELLQRIENGDYLIAHHAIFDVTILANEGLMVDNYICSCKVARKILRPEGVPRFGLQFLKDYLQLEELNSHDTLTGYAHSALYDTKVLFWLYQYLYEKIEQQYPNDDPHQVMIDITHTVTPTKVLGFGKYKGFSIKEISIIDKGYLQWLHESESSKKVPRKALLLGIEKYL